DGPRNIRALRNVIERAVAFCPRTEIGPDDLPDTIGAPGDRAGAFGPVAPGTAALSATCTLGEAKEGAEASRILDALRRHNNNRLRAAQELGISRMTLYK